VIDESAGTEGMRAIARRVMSLAKIYDHLLGNGLSRTIDFDRYLRSLCASLREVQDNREFGVALTCDSEPCPLLLDLDAVTALGCPFLPCDPADRPRHPAQGGDREQRCVPALVVGHDDIVQGDIARVADHVDLLVEHRQALITAAVTVLRGACSGPLVRGSVRIRGGLSSQRSALTAALCRIADAAPIKTRGHQHRADQGMRRGEILDVKEVDAVAEDLRLVVLLDAETLPRIAAPETFLQ
jgi:hypothetical protein